MCDYEVMFIQLGLVIAVVAGIVGYSLSYLF